MSVKQRVVRTVVEQFHHPRGPFGHAVGWLMAHRGSNTSRNRWAVSLLDVQRTDRMLEIGCGPGIALHEVARHLGDGVVVGVDHSAVMVRQARRRNANGIRAGRVEVQLAAADALPDLGAPFDKMLAVNSIGFWPDPIARLQELRGRLRLGGRIAVVSQPRCPGATANTSARAGNDLAGKLTAAGFTDLRIETLPLSPPAVCVLSKKAD